MLPGLNICVDLYTSSDYGDRLRNQEVQRQHLEATDIEFKKKKLRRVMLEYMVRACLLVYHGSPPWLNGCLRRLTGDKDTYPCY